MNKSLIIYQSIAEISEILRILQNSNKGKFTIIVTGGEALTLVLKKLKLKEKFRIKIYEFQALKLKNPLNIIKMFIKFNYSQNLKKILSHKYKNVIFFNYCTDFVAPIFLCRLKSKNFTFINFYRREFTKGKLGFKQFIQILLLKILYIKINLKIAYDENHKQLFFFPQKKKIINKLPICNITKSLFKLPILKKNIGHDVIYFDSYEERFYGKLYKQTLFNIFKIINEKGYNIIIKKHPVAKLSNCVIGLKKSYYIKDPLPIELYDLSNVKYVFGLYSTGLSKVAEKYKSIKVFSFLRLLDTKKDFSYEVNHLKTMSSSGKIFFPKNYNQIKKIF